MDQDQLRADDFPHPRLVGVSSGHPVSEIDELGVVFPILHLVHRLPDRLKPAITELPGGSIQPKPVVCEPHPCGSAAEQQLLSECVQLHCQAIHSRQC
jgi:hypothetical protein